MRFRLRLRTLLVKKEAVSECKAVCCSFEHSHSHFRKRSASFSSWIERGNRMRTLMKHFKHHRKAINTISIPYPLKTFSHAEALSSSVLSIAGCACALGLFLQTSWSQGHFAAELIESIDSIEPMSKSFL